MHKFAEDFGNLQSFKMKGMWVNCLFSVVLLMASLIVKRVLKSIGFLSGSCSVSACSRPRSLSKQYFNQLIFAVGGCLADFLMLNEPSGA